MPEKRPSPLMESPPDASSSSSSDDEEMEEIVEEEVKSVDNEEEDIEEEEEEEEDEEEEEEEEDDSGFTVKKHVVPSPQPQSSSVGEEEEEEEEEEESDSESGSDSDLPPENTKSSTRAVNTVIDPNVKPLTSIPMDDGNAKLLKKSSSTEKPKSTVIPSKRPAAKMTTTDKQEDSSSKRRKKSGGGGGGDGEESEKKSSNKLWSEDDEVVILKGMVSLIKKGAKPTSDMNLLLEQIKASIHFDVTRDQLHNKIRRLKQKYQGNLKREMEEEGEELQFPKAHDSKCYELSKKVWGEKDLGKVEGTTEASNGVVDSVKKKQVKSRSRKPTTNAAAAVVSPPHIIIPKEVSTLAENTPNLSSSSYFNEIGKNSIEPPEGLKGFLAKEALELMGSTKAKALEKKWRKLQFAEAKLYLERVELVREQLKMVVDAVGSPEE